METYDFPYELKITIEASNKRIADILSHQPFQECKKLMSSFSITFS